MAVTVELMGTTATILDLEWSSNDSLTANLLNNLTDADDISAADPFPDFHEAQRIAALMNGKVTEIKEEGKFVRDRKY